MKTLLQLLIVAIGVVSIADAQVKEFPYKAQVVTDEAYVRSGDGDRFYPTDSLVRGAIVTVRRHDAGGWYKIDPPEGSFSWILQSAVRQTSADAGDVTSAQAIAMVGSKFGDEIGVWQRKMLAGEKVTILEERIVDTEQGPKPMFKIKPPAREYRWIPGSAVVPIGDRQKADHDRNPYVVPSSIAERTRRLQPPPTAEQPAPISRYSPSHRLARLQRIRGEQRDLHEIDQKFRNMILSPPGQWDLESIETAYRDLQNNATHKPVAGQIDLRFPAINRYRLRKAQLNELNELTSATERRDAQLLAAQFGTAQGMAYSPDATLDGALVGGGLVNGGIVDGSMMAVGSQPAVDAFAFDNSIPQSEFSGAYGNAMPIPEANFPFTASTISAHTSSNSNLVIPGSNSQVSPSSRYIGAGFLQRDPGRGDGYILTTPAGKVLAHLQPDGDVNLAKHVGQSVGLQGKRYFDSEVKHDRIEVSSLEPIRLKH